MCRHWRERWARSWRTHNGARCGRGAASNARRNGPRRRRLPKSMWRFIKRPSTQAAQPPQQLDLSPARRVLVVAPHPDDETLGCGGTLARLAPLCEVHLLLVTNGDGGGALPTGTSQTRKKE